MKTSDLSEQALTDAMKVFSAYPNGHVISWSEFEQELGVDIRPQSEETHTNEWRGYIQTRNMLRNTVNGMAMDVDEHGKRGTFQFRPYREDDGSAALKKMGGEALYQSLLKHHQMKVQRAPKNMVQVMEEVNKKVYLASPKSRNKLTNMITIGKVLLNQTRALIDTAVNDPDIQLPQYAHDELLRISYEAASDVDHDVERKEVEA